jgi:hypothetical protein
MWCLESSLKRTDERNAGPLRLRSGQAFDSAEVRFAQDDRLFLAAFYAAFRSADRTRKRFI